MTEKDADLENEHAHLVRLIESEGWKIYRDKWSKLLDECSRTMREPECSNRDWYAGLVTGYQRLLEYPTNRIATIEKLWKNSKPV